MANASHSTIALVVAAYFVVSITLVFSNKFLLSSDVSIPAPLFVTWFQCVLTALIIYGLGSLGRGAPSGTFLAQFPDQNYDWAVARKVLPLSIIFVGMITFNNLCLQYISVSFYNVARSLTIVANVIFSYLILGDKTSFRVGLTLLVVILGFYVGSEGEVEFSFLGTVFGVLSSCFVSLNSIFTKSTMKHVQDNKWKLSYYNNVNASLLFLPLILFSGEVSTLAANTVLLMNSYYWVLMSIAGVLGFLIGIVSVMQIDYTSPLTHNISGTAKACVQTILAWAVLHNAMTWKSWTGNFLVIFGSLTYTWVKIMENEKPAQPAYSSVPTADKGEVDLEMGKMSQPK